MIVAKFSRLLFNILIAVNLKLMFGFRAFLLSRCGAKVGRNLKVNAFVVIDYPSNLNFGENVSINQFTKISAAGGVEIGDCVSIANGVSIFSATHPASRNFKFATLTTRSLKIGSNVWIGTNSVIMADVCDNCIIGANSLVNKDLGEPGVYVGSPVRMLKKL